MATKLSTPIQYQELVDKYDNFLFDCDGVVWRGETLIPGVKQTIEYLRSQNKRIVFVTNTAVKSRQECKEKFDRMGLEANIDEIFTASYAAAIYISKVLRLPPRKKLYVIGMEGIETELSLEGISFLGGTDPIDNTLKPFTSLEEWVPDKDVVGVLCSGDYSINYTKLTKALYYLQTRRGEPEGEWGGECKFLLTNLDNTCPVKGGNLPGAGSLTAPLVYATNRQPITIGKPGPTMMNAIKQRYNLDLNRTVMVGDRLDTDIEFGKNGGVATALVLTGATDEAKLTASTMVIPDYVLASLGDLQVLDELSGIS